MNNAVLGKTAENVRKHRDPNYYKKWFLEYLLAIVMEKAKLKMSKPVYLGL